MPFKRLAYLIALFACALVAPAALADTITLASQTGSSYSFDVYAADGTLAFRTGNTITLSGFSNITDVTLSSSATAFGSVSYTDSTVTFVAQRSTSYRRTAPLAVSLLTVTTATPTSARIDYSLVESSASFTDSIALSNLAATNTNGTSGTTVTPEPASLLLLSTGVSGLTLLRRRHRQAATPAVIHQSTHNTPA